jgi:hypothetical protein
LTVKRVSNSRTIGEIEFIIGAPSVGDARRSWIAHGVECTRDRHRFSGRTYQFTIEVVELRLVKSGRMSWHAMIVTQWWRSGDEDTDLRSTKWLKVLRGRPSDVTAWMLSCRAKLESTALHRSGP